MSHQIKTLFSPSGVIIVLLIGLIITIISFNSKLDTLERKINRSLSSQEFNEKMSGVKQSIEDINERR